MYLKSIEIQGFKSFANKITFEFHNGITGIVGPNGSGKSNVADAVRWVLGEQKVKQLRGGSMQDVIFAGTELRKPQGFAYVAITLDNSDHKLPISYDEVTVSRRLYRSGESEYKINGTSCRLRDVHELFYDTGIGQEGYSIIGQGQIEKILSGRPEERRELFDEAAGIVKFKRRKIIALKKLDTEQQNLLRVTDLLNELERRVGPLKRQSETAKEYLRLHDILKNLDVNLFLDESESIRKNIGELTDRKRIVGNDIADVENSITSLKAEHDEVSGKLTELDETLAAKRAELNEANLKEKTFEGNMEVLSEQIHTEEINVQHIETRISAINFDLGTKNTDKSAYETELSDLETSIEEILDELDKAEIRLDEKDVEIIESERKADEAKSLIITALNDKADLFARRQHFETLYQQLGVRKAEISQKLIKVKSDESVQEEEIKKSEQNLKDINHRLAEALEKEEKLTKKKRHEEATLNKLNGEKTTCDRELNTNKTKLESLKNLTERYEGYGGSIRHVMEQKNKVSGIHGVVADIIKAEAKYETAIETALGGSIQNIVTDNENTATKLIEFLKKNRLGRATFLPLTSMKNHGKFQQQEALNEPGIVGLASKLVSADDKYKDLIDNLLGRVVVASDINYAIALARKYRYSMRIVTLDGELLSPGGSMTGGTFKNNSNLLGRRREIEDLEKKIESLNEKLETLAASITQHETILSQTNESLADVAEQKHKLSIEQNTEAVKSEQLLNKKLEISDSSVDLVQEESDIADEMAEIEETLNGISDEEKALEKYNKEKNDENASHEKGIENLRSEREKLAKKLSEVQLKAAEINQKKGFAEENVKRLEQEISALEEELKGLEAQKLESAEKTKNIQTEITNAENESANLQIICMELDDEIAELEANREEVAATQKTFFDRQQELSERKSLLDKDYIRIENGLERQNSNLTEKSDYMWSEYGLTYSTALPLKDESLGSMSEIRKQANEIKDAIKGLGNVNVNAIEEYKEQSERYEFMKTQHDDLVESEAELLKIIEELDEGMRKQFKEKFSDIQKQFDVVFRELFGGGHGTIELAADEDILEAGIQIISQPPGKKLQNMMQLSGGEKALTAIALLFAIQSLKPSPFCLLDEIEAALDDSNVDRFAGYLHKLTKDTQFIVITHRRGTMVSADRLYGITMQEKGISTLVSVSLIADEMAKEEREKK